MHIGKSVLVAGVLEVSPIPISVLFPVPSPFALLPWGSRHLSSFGWLILHLDLLHSEKHTCFKLFNEKSKLLDIVSKC